MLLLLIILLTYLRNKYTLSNMKYFKITITHFKILDTIDYLNTMKKYPLNEGVYKIVAGIFDEETINYRNAPTFSTLISYNSKKVSRYISALEKNGYVHHIFDPKTNNLYLEICRKGKDALYYFHKRHPLNYPKKERKINQTIVEL